MVVQRIRKYASQIGVPIQPEYRKVLGKAASLAGLSLSAYARMILIEHAFQVQKTERFIMEELGYEQADSTKRSN